MDNVKKCPSHNFATYLGYKPVNLVLSKGWLAWIFQYEQDATRILYGSWSFGSQMLSLKKWLVSFNATTERQKTTLISLFLPRLPLIFWTEYVFGIIGCPLVYLEAYLSFFDIVYMATVHILVRIKLFKGLYDQIIHSTPRASLL
jgi:hypothetical protein